MLLFGHCGGIGHRCEEKHKLSKPLLRVRSHEVSLRNSHGWPMGPTGYALALFCTMLGPFGLHLGAVLVNFGSILGLGGYLESPW